MFFAEARFNYELELNIYKKFFFFMLDLLIPLSVTISIIVAFKPLYPESLPAIIVDRLNLGSNSTATVCVIFTLICFLIITIYGLTWNESLESIDSTTWFINFVIILTAIVPSVAVGIILNLKFAGMFFLLPSFMYLNYMIATFAVGNKVKKAFNAERNINRSVYATLKENEQDEISFIELCRNAKEQYLQKIEAHQEERDRLMKNFDTTIKGLMIAIVIINIIFSSLCITLFYLNISELVNKIQALALSSVSLIKAAFSFIRFLLRNQRIRALESSNKQLSRKCEMLSQENARYRNQDYD